MKQLTNKQIIAALRCTSSVDHDCDGDRCPFFVREKTPEDLQAECGKETWDSCDVDGVAMDAADRLAYYEDMEEQGRLKIFPCEVGNKAYWANGGQIKECKVHRIQVNRKGTFLVLKSKVIHGAFNIGTIGHTVFFDREEAEQALKEGK